MVKDMNEKERYVCNNGIIYDTKKEKEMPLDEVVRRMNLMDKRIHSQQERINDFLRFEGFME